MKNDFKSFLAVEFSNIYSCFYRLGEAHVTMKSCLGVWILFCCKIILSKNVSVKALSTNGFLRYVVQAQIK